MLRYRIEVWRNGKWSYWDICLSIYTAVETVNNFEGKYTARIVDLKTQEVLN